MKNITKLFVLSLASFMLISCGNNSNTSGNEESETVTEWNDKSSITVDALSTTIEVGATYQINAKGNGTLTYVSTDESIATVNNTGLVTGVAEGDAYVKVSDSSDFVYIKIHVGAASGAQIDGTLSVYLQSKNLDLYIGETYTVNPKAMVSGKEVEKVTFSFESSNSSVASVDNGKITAASSGTAIIKVTANSEGTIATAQIVVDVKEELIYLVPDFETREVVTGSPIDLNVALIRNAEAITEGVGSPSFAVSDTGVAYVLNNQLFAISKGRVELTATVDYKGQDYSFTVKITTRELYKITYSDNGEKIYEEYVKSGDCISYTDVPTKVDCVFKAWDNGEKLIYGNTPIDYSMDLEPKWLVYSDDVLSEETKLLWDYSTGSEITTNNNTGCYLWEDYQYPDCHINILLINKTLLLTDIYLPKFEYSLYPAVSFYFYNHFYNTQFVFGGFESATIDKGARNQVSVVGNKLFYNGVDTGETVDEGVVNATESFHFQIKTSVNNGGKMCLSGFYCHLSDE